MFESGLLQTAEVPRSIHRLDYTTQLHMPIIKSTPTTHIHKPTTIAGGVRPFHTFVSSAAAATAQANAAWCCLCWTQTQHRQ